jgi:hypothetical protein
VADETRPGVPSDGMCEAGPSGIIELLHTVQPQPERSAPAVDDNLAGAQRTDAEAEAEAGRPRQLSNSSKNAIGRTLSNSRKQQQQVVLYLAPRLVRL